MTEHEAKTYAIRRKREGATYREIVAELREAGATNPKRGKPYGRHSVTAWCLSVSPALGDQRGKRHPHLIGLTPEERAAHDREMHERKLERARQWRRSNREYLREWARQYRRYEW